MVAIFSDFSQIVYNRFRIIKLQEIMVNICNKIIVQTFEIIYKNKYAH